MYSVLAHGACYLVAISWSPTLQFKGVLQHPLSHSSVCICQNSYLCAIFFIAKEAMEYIKLYVKDFDVPASCDSSSVHESLKDGVALCKLMNALKESSVRRINDSKMAFKQMENIGNYLDAASGYGVAKSDQFQTVDLYEAQNMAAVITQLHALGRKAQSKGKQGIGPKESAKNEREFTDEQMRAGSNVIGLQMGSNKGASQAGQNFGKTRAIID